MQYSMAHLTEQKPSGMHYDSWAMTVNAQGKWSKQKETPDKTIVCDGKTQWWRSGNTCMANPLLSHYQLRTLHEPWGGFFPTGDSPCDDFLNWRVYGKVADLRIDGSEMCEDVLCQKISMHWKFTERRAEDQFTKDRVVDEVQTTWDIGPDLLVRHESNSAKLNGKPGWMTDFVVRDIQTNAPVAEPDKLFTYLPDAGVHFVKIEAPKTIDVVASKTDWKAPKLGADAMNLLKRVQTVMLSLKSYSAECDKTTLFLSQPQGRMYSMLYRKEIVKSQKPNREHDDNWLIEADEQGAWSQWNDAASISTICDGKTQWFPMGNSYGFRSHIRLDRLDINREPMGGFFSAQHSPYGRVAYWRSRGKVAEVRLCGSEMCEGVLCKKVFMHYHFDGGGIIDVQRISYIGPDGLLRREVSYFEDSKRRWTEDAVVRNICVNLPIPDAAKVFTYVPPKGAEKENLDIYE
jgi:hypothetical protein